MVDQRSEIKDIKEKIQIENMRGRVDGTGSGITLNSINTPDGKVPGMWKEASPTL